MSWVISEIGEPILQTNNQGQPVISLSYNASNRDFEVAVFEDDCTTTSPVPGLDFAGSASSTSGFINIDVNITLVQGDLENSPVWEDTSNTTGSLSFCVSTFLYVNETKIVSREDIIFKVDFDNKLDFTVEGISTSHSEPTINDSFEVAYNGQVNAYECDPSTMEQLSSPPSHGPYDLLNICVEEVSSEEFVVSSIFDFKIKLVGTLTIFEAIVNGEVPADYEDLAYQKCENKKCMATVVLLNDFFTGDDANELQVTGTVVLKPDQNVREGKAEEQYASGGFSVTLGLDKPCRDGSGTGIISALLSGSW